MAGRAAGKRHISPARPPRRRAHLLSALLVMATGLLCIRLAACHAAWGPALPLTLAVPFQFAFFRHMRGAAWPAGHALMLGVLITCLLTIAAWSVAHACPPRMALTFPRNP